MEHGEITRRLEGQVPGGRIGDEECVGMGLRQRQRHGSRSQSVLALALARVGGSVMSGSPPLALATPLVCDISDLLHLKVCQGWGGMDCHFLSTLASGLGPLGFFDYFFCPMSFLAKVVAMTFATTQSKASLHQGQKLWLGKS